jgi:hypothetical protein
MIKVEIDGVGIVELDDSFSELSPAEQQKTVNEISAKYTPRRSSDIEKAGAVAAGFNTGALADTFGAPFDLVNAGLSAVGLGTEAPFGGSESIKRLLASVSIPGYGSMGYIDEQDLPKDQRALARGGRTAGQVTGMAAPGFGMAGRLSPAQALMQSPPGKSAVRSLASEMVKSTARNPGQMAAIEGASAYGAGQARMIAEDVAPGDEYVGTAAELVGGVLSPLALARKPIDAIKGFTDTLSPSGRERAASNKVLELLKKQNPGITDEQITGIADQLRKVDDPGRTAQVTSDELARKTFTAMDNKLIADAGDEAKTAIKNQNKKTTEAFNRKIRQIQNSGNPEMVKEAARIRLDMFTKRMQTRVDNAESRVGEAVAKVLNKNSDDAVSASREARRIIDGELQKARQTETQLWGEVDKSVTAPGLGFNTVQKADKIKAEMLPEEKLPKPIEAFINRLTAQEKPIAAKELFIARSRALEMAREATAKSKFGQARRMNEIADSMLDDLMTVTDETATVARDFSRNLNERFNTKLIKGIRDAEPEVALEKGIGAASDTQRALNIQAMRRATESSGAREQLAKTQKNFIQAGATRVIDSQTGQISPKKLADLIKDNPQTLREVGLLDDVTNMDQQVRLAKILQKTADDGKGFAQKQSIASQIIDKDGTRGGLKGVVNKAFESKFQGEAFRDLTNIVKRAKNPEALEGLRHEVFGTLLSKATIKGGDLDGLISGKQLEELLSSKVGDKTLRQNLLSSKLVTPEQLTNLAHIGRKARIFEEAATDPTKLNAIITTGDGVVNLLARVIGSKVGANSALGKVLGGTTLIAQSAFSKMAQKTIEKVPATKIQDVLTKAMEDQKFMAMLLEMGPKAPKQVNTRINAYLLQAGLLED